MAEILSIQAHLDGIFEVLSQHLYSSPEVFIRELIQNAHDAITRRRFESPDSPAGKITIKTDPARHMFIINDNGSGMTRDELKSYLTTIGDGYTKSLRDRPESQDVIGRFGLGFLTAYSVSSDIRVHTRSANETGFVLHAQDFRTFSIEDLPKGSVGTEITLKLKPEFQVFAQPAEVARIATYYFEFLKTYLTLNGKRINKILTFHEQATEQAVQLRNRRKDLELLKSEFGVNALLTLDLNTKDGRVKLWLLDSLSLGKVDHRSIQLYVRGVRVKHPPKDLIPAWASFCGGFVFSSEMELTASREHVKASDLVENIKAAIHNCLVEQLIRIAAEERSLFRQIEKRYLRFLVDGMAVDYRLFEALCPLINVPTNKGLLSLDEIFGTYKTVYMSSGRHWMSEAILFMTLDRPVINVQNHVYSLLVTNFAEKRNVQAILVDGPQSLVGLFGEAEPCERLPYLQNRYQVLMARFNPSEIPCILIPNTKYMLKKEFESDDAESRYSKGLLTLAQEFTRTVKLDEARHSLYLNLNNTLVEKMLDTVQPPKEMSLRIFQTFVDMVSAQTLANDQRGFLDNFKNLQDLILAVEA